MDTGFARTGSSRDWADSPSTLSMHLSDHMYQQNPTFQLHVFQKKEHKSERPIITSTKCERLSFYRTFTASANKTEILCRHYSQFNRFLWLYTLNTIFKSLPHTFVQIFIAAYAPEQHIFLTKMVRFCIGFNYLLIIASFFEILTYLDSLILLFHYFANGILFKNPWNRCENSTNFDEALNTTIHCYSLEEFIDRFVNTTYIYSGYVYKTANNESFQVAQVEFYRLCLEKEFYYQDLAYFALLWTVMAWLSLFAAKSYIWKALHVCHWTSIAIDTCIFLYLIGTHTTYELERQREGPHDYLMNQFWLGDIDMLAESTTAPPITHILTARSTQRINPSEDSTAIVLSNAVYYLLRQLLTDKMMNYCEWVLKAPIYHYTHNFFYLWPIFYSKFYFGDIYHLVYLAVTLFTEILSVAIVFRCLIDTAYYEWTNIKFLIIAVVAVLSAISVHSYTSRECRLILYLYAKGFATLSETFFLYLVYPLGRLVDDYTFHYGVSPTRLTKLSLQLVPFYYLVKFIMLIKTIFDMSDYPYFGVASTHYEWFWCLILLPLILGMIYIIYRDLVIRKLTWHHIFRPVSKWGPKDFAKRQLRKQYDSRLYIRSDVPRLLSRYLMSKAESKVYKLDVRYDFYRKSPSLGKAIMFKES